MTLMDEERDEGTSGEHDGGTSGGHDGGTSGEREHDGGTSGGPGEEPGGVPPRLPLLLDAVLGVITVVAVVIAWRTLRRGAIRIAAGARIISALTALPAFFVDVPAGLKAAVGIFVLVTAAAVAMMLSPARRPVSD